MQLATLHRMAMIVVGLVQDPHQARGLVRALEDDGFELEDIDVAGDLLTELLARGVPEKEAPLYVEGVRRGGMLVFVRADDDDEAAEAAETMAEHGVVDIDACAAARWQGEYPVAPGRIYHDSRSTGAAPRAYDGPERRRDDEPYPGTNRRTF